MLLLIQCSPLNSNLLKTNFRLIQIPYIELIPYSGKLSREKTFTNFAIFPPSAKVFSTKFQACHTHYATTFNIPQKFSPRNAPFPPIRESFLPRKFPAIRYINLNWFFGLIRKITASFSIHKYRTYISWRSLQSSLRYETISTYYL